MPELVGSWTEIGLEREWAEDKRGCPGHWPWSPAKVELCSRRLAPALITSTPRMPMSQPGWGVDTATQHYTQNTSRQPCFSAPTLLGLQCTESKPKSGMVHKPVWDLALSYTPTSPTSIAPSLMLHQPLYSPCCFPNMASLSQSGLGSGSFSLSQSAPPHMANSYTFFKTLFKCHLPQEVSPDHHTLIASQTLPPQPLGNPDPS